jgi:hypothetical protein
MKKLALATVSLALLASSGVFSNAFAQEVTRAEVRQQLVQAENNGSRFVTDASYPEVSPIYAQQVARLKAQNDSGMGADTSGTSASGARAPMHAMTVKDACVGPASFCKPYFGS